jgi:hypothetical protein
MLSYHYGIKLELNNKKRTVKLLNSWILNNTLYKTQCVKEGTSMEIF